MTVRGKMMTPTMNDVSSFLIRKDKLSYLGKAFLIRKVSKTPFGKKVRFRRDLGSANTKIQEPGAENPKINIQEPKYF